ncbi:RING/FYVE/PHD zinc finger superfamily protein [Hirschfeldia incana]|nr:RING/FYVE/PHD zinc finger superfamily protein [Hirschfeldia incana]
MGLALVGSHFIFLVTIAVTVKSLQLSFSPRQKLLILSSSSSMTPSSAELPTGKDRSKPTSSSNHSVTGNSELDNWIWIIEYIAKFKTELWMLHDLFEMTPKEFPENLGEDTNEMVAFRCLASLFDYSNSDDAESKIEFDSSHSCQHVLQCILDEIPLSELKPGAPGLSKWNIAPFIKSKLLCLPKCALELMIESSETDAEEGMRIDGNETDQVTSPIADPEPFGHSPVNETSRSHHGPGDEANETSRSHHGPGDGADEICRSKASLENGGDSYVSSPPSENIYRCVQCKQSGKLLFCSRDGCTVMVHEKCVVDSPPVYDDAGNFYCSLCALGCVSAEYLQSQEEVAKAKKKLLSFLRLMSNVNKRIKPNEG